MSSVHVYIAFLCIADLIESYEGALRAEGLPSMPFRASSPMNGKDLYSGFGLRARKMLLGSFWVFFRHMPVKYHAFAYATRQFAPLEKTRKKLIQLSFIGSG